MSLNLQDKKRIVIKIREVMGCAVSVVVADFRGVTVDKITELRKEGRKIGVYIYVIRNTLIRLVIEGTMYECLKEAFIGPTLIAFSTVHPGAAARLLKEFSKLNPTFKIKAAAFEGEYIPVDQIDRLATLPTYEEAISILMSVMREASVGKFFRIMISLRDKKMAV